MTTAIVAAVIFVNLLVDVLAVMAVLGLMADEKANSEGDVADVIKNITPMDTPFSEKAADTLGLLLDRKE
jgi:hypothetical protein